MGTDGRLLTDCGEGDEPKVASHAEVPSLSLRVKQTAREQEDDRQQDRLDQRL